MVPESEGTKSRIEMFIIVEMVGIQKGHTKCALSQQTQQLSQAFH